MKPVVYSGRVAKNKFTPASPEAWALKFNYHEGKDIEIEIRRKRKARSTNQNKYYWKVVIGTIANAPGYENDPKVIHDAMRYMFLSTTDARGLTITKSTTDLSTAEMETYMEQIRRWAATLTDAIFIPDPNQ